MADLQTAGRTSAAVCEPPTLTPLYRELMRSVLCVINHRLWAEVFHVSMSSGSGTVKWQQVSEDLVPVSISCVQDSPECIFHISAYNSQVDKILDVRLSQPGTQRMETPCICFNIINITPLHPRDTNRTGVRVLCLLEGSDDQRHVGPKFHLTHRCETVPGVLRK